MYRRRLARGKEDVEEEDAQGNDEFEPQSKNTNLGVKRGVSACHHPNVRVAEETTPREGCKKWLDVQLRVTADPLSDDRRGMRWE